MVINTYCRSYISVARSFNNLVPRKNGNEDKSYRNVCAWPDVIKWCKIEQNIWSDCIQTTSNSQRHSTTEVSTDQGRVIYVLLCLIFLVDICKNYQNLTDAERSFDYATQDDICQMSSVFITYLFTHLCISFSWCMSLAKLPKSTNAERKHDYVTVNFECDETLDGWYRFQGAAGTKMVTICLPTNRSDAAYPIWLNGSHPTVAEGTVSRTVCINKYSRCGISFPIKVKNCSSYYIYKLIPLTDCDARYCSTD